MIALNEIISKKDLFEEKYKLMDKKINLDKIIKLEKDFINLDKKANKLRSNCNKLCGEIAELINSNTDTSDTISKINSIDKEILMLEKKSTRAMKKINKKLKKLPNLSLEDNVLNVSVKTKFTKFSKVDLLENLNQIAKIQTIAQSYKKYISSLEKVVFKAETLPQIIKLNDTKQQKFVILCGTNAIEILNNIQNILINNAKYLTIKSIKQLKKESSKEIYATLSDNSFISVKFSGEFISRENLIKLYDKQLDMTKFINIIYITIK